MKEQRGFSLPELLVVLAVIAVIASFVFPRFGTARNTADEDAARATASSLLTSVSAYYMVSECYPREVPVNTMPSGLSPYVGGQWPQDFDYEQNTSGVGVSWRPGGTLRWTQWLVQGSSYTVCP
jgi:prepilin-type N-terminal cleavage/methylation domain-containing protein